MLAIGLHVYQRSTFHYTRYSSPAPASRPHHIVAHFNPVKTVDHALRWWPVWRIPESPLWRQQTVLDNHLCTFLQDEIQMIPSQLSALSFTNRKEFMLILLLPSRKERTRPSPVVQQITCPFVHSQVMMDLELRGMNGNWVYFMSCRKLAGNPAGVLAGKKRFYLVLCVSLEKYMALFFLEIAGRKRKTYPPHWV